MHPGDMSRLSAAPRLSGWKHDAPRRSDAASIRGSSTASSRSGWRGCRCCSRGREPPTGRRGSAERRPPAPGIVPAARPTAIPDGRPRDHLRGHAPPHLPRAGRTSTRVSVRRRPLHVAERRDRRTSLLAALVVATLFAVVIIGRAACPRVSRACSRPSSSSARLGARRPGPDARPVRGRRSRTAPGCSRRSATSEAAAGLTAERRPDRPRAPRRRRPIT